MDIRHGFQGWKLSKPYVTKLGLRHSLHLDALDWGIRLWFGQKGLGSEGLRFELNKITHLWRCAPLWHTTQCTQSGTLHLSAFHALVNCVTMHA